VGAVAAGAAVAVVVAKHESGCGSFTIDVTPDLSGQVNCNTPTQPIAVAGSNPDCPAVAITSASVQVSVTSGPCTGGNVTRPLTVLAAEVPSGGRNVPIAEGAIGHSVAGCCLNGGSCGSTGFSCDVSEVYTVQTSKGAVSSTNHYTIQFPAGSSCVPCDASSASCRGPLPTR
jgi:hypothetical protein